MPESKEKRIVHFLESRSNLSREPVRLRGDASMRSFYRVAAGRGSVIMIVLEDPRPEEELPYISMRNHLSSCGVNVPEIYEYDSINGILLVEDFGDVTLEEKVRNVDEEAFSRYYRIAVDELLKIQILGTCAPGDCTGFHLAFDSEKLMQELDFFLEHTVGGFFRAKLTHEERETVSAAFTDLAGELASFPRVLNHRDYHSRNLMVMDESIRIVDFQDARMGPCQYDLASLLKDSYTVLDGSCRDELIEYYLAGCKESGIDWYDEEQFLYRFEMMSLQRNLKACGTFGYMAVERGDESYLQYLAPTFRYIRGYTPWSKKISECVKVLSRHIPLLR
jgi:aminoglycoside/choline kinase family phosphotransferase